MITSIDAKIRSSWQVPDFKVLYWQGKQQNYCVVIPVINEGDRIINLLQRIVTLEVNKISDVIIVDGGSSDKEYKLSDKSIKNLKKFVGEEYDIYYFLKEQKKIINMNFVKYYKNY